MPVDTGGGVVFRDMTCKLVDGWVLAFGGTSANCIRTTWFQFTPMDCSAVSGGFTVRLTKLKLLGPLQGPGRGPSNALEMS